MLTLEHYGMPLTWQRITPGNTVTSIAEGVWRYEEMDVTFSTGGTTVPVKGDVIIGATSGKSAIIMSVTVASGAWSTSDAAGTLRVKSATGQFTATEKLKIAADADTCEVVANKQVPDNYPNKMREARALLIQAETNPQRIIFDGDGAKTDQTGKFGVVLTAAQSILITSPNAIKNLQTVDATAGTAGTTIIVGFF